MNCTFDLGGKYIPTWRDNDKLPESDQIVIEWEYPNTTERSKIQYYTSPKFKDGGVDSTIEYIIDRVKLVETCVKKIKNLNVNGTVIDTGEKLVACKGLYNLTDEVAIFLIPKLREIDTKN